MEEFVRYLKFVFFCGVSLIIELFFKGLLGSLGVPSNIIVDYLILLVYIVCDLLLNRKFTFQSDNNKYIALLKLTIFYLIYVPVSNMLVNYVGEDNHSIIIIMVVFNLLLEYMYQKYFIFLKTIDKKIVKF